MPALSDYTAGTITLTNGSTAFTGSGTGWQAADFREGDTILGIEDNAGVEYVIATITGNGAGTLTQEWEGATGTYTYRMRYLADGARVTAQARNLIELLDNGNLQALAGLTGPGVPVFNGPHAMTIKPETDFINGVAYDVQVDTLADRAAYNGQSAGFSVLVSNMGDGRSALFSKASNASGDWTDAAYITGPSVSVTVGTTTEGPFGSDPDVTGVTGAGTLQLNFELPGSPSIDATVTSASPGTPASVVTTPIAGGYELDFTLPGASGFYNAGVYDIGEAYSLDDVVRHNGSSFIALQAVPAGQSPSSAFPPVDTAYWQVLAAKGSDGTITGVTPFWQGRILNDADAAQARAGLVVDRLPLIPLTEDPLADFNTLITAGWHDRIVTGTQPNGYGGNLFGYLLVVSTPGQARTQVVLPHREMDGPIRLRSRTNVGVWGQWRSVWDSLNLLRPSNPEIDAGASTTLRGWSASDIVRAISQHGGSDDPWGNQPLGVPIPVLDTLIGVSAPTNDSVKHYIKLTASDPFNAGALTGESVSGSAPLIQATAVISLPGSPLNGQTVRLINTERRVLRAGASGTVENDAIENITGSTTQGLKVSGGYTATGVFDYTRNTTVTGANGTQLALDGSLSFDASRVARTSNETRPKNLGVTYYLRIK